LRPEPAKYLKQLNTLGDHIRARRLNLNLLQMQVADQFGVHEQTITNWERNASSPEIRYIPTILTFLEYDPFPPAQSLSERLATVRKMLGLSQQSLALVLGVDPGTCQSWEAGQHEPTRKRVELIERFLSVCGNSPSI
jgi:DNA-binding transcriptional regulator YiaG